MKIFILILVIFLLNGCSQKIADCNPVPCQSIYPKLPTYKTPQSNNISEPEQLGDGTCIIAVDDLIELVGNNKKLRRICSNYAIINKRVNKEYSK